MKISTQIFNTSNKKHKKTRDLCIISLEATNRKIFSVSAQNHTNLTVEFDPFIHNIDQTCKQKNINWIDANTSPIYVKSFQIKVKHYSFQIKKF